MVGLINGRGRYSLNDYGSLSVFNVQQSVSYRFRLIGAQSLYAYKFEIEDHKLRITATDGQIVHLSETVDYIIIHSGEHYDFILDTKDNGGNYWIRAETLENITTESDSRQVHSAEAILHYTALGVLDPNPFNLYSDVNRMPRQCTQQSMCSAYNCPFLEFPSSYNTTCMAVSQLRNRFSTDLPKIDNMDSNRLKFLILVLKERAQQVLLTVVISCHHRLLIRRILVNMAEMWRRVSIVSSVTQTRLQRANRISALVLTWRKAVINLVTVRTKA